MKPLPHVITDDEFFFATEEQRKEWNARMAAGTEPHDLSVCAPLNIPKFNPLRLFCTPAEYEAATLEQQKDWDEALIRFWVERRLQELEEDIEADNQRGSWGE